MADDLDIYRSAYELVKQHGDDAPIHAAMRADAMLEAGDMDGRAVWLRIIKAIDDLTSVDVPDTTHLHPDNNADTPEPGTGLGVIAKKRCRRCPGVCQAGFLFTLIK